MSYTPIHAAYTKWYARLSTEISMQQTGAWSVFHSIHPMEQIATLQKDLADAAKTKKEAAGTRRSFGSGVRNR
ncbi:hypothetical protein K432DRAFT_361168 [Lepidopterella palustris CBS 459.81]|uniref:Uncharacterized protein n=1 Tax=Lepidopterella palustris CBS 459.81 TaxID=1314670 RepID=A0A8E2JB03_9PEZI|nr:hypothetical protein K432DRAFT_361168 [Lepidopterella palustris CBS 459.81]